MQVAAEGGKMTGNDYQAQAMRTNDGKNINRLNTKIFRYHRFNPDVPALEKVGNKDVGGILYACLGLSGEVGETVDLVKKWIFHDSPLDETHLKKEIGDVMWYIAEMCDSFGYDLDEIMQMNIDKHRKRYPNGFNTYDANHRRSDDV